jgi:hypothetical protein
MKKLLLALLGLTLLLPAALWAEEEESSIKSGVRSVVSGIVSTGKNAVSGVSEGVEQGRQEGESVDGAHVVMNKEQFLALLSASVLKSENLGGNQYRVTVAFKNDNEFPVRVANLSEPANVIILDRDGFSSPLSPGQGQGSDLTALPRSLTRGVFVFSQVEADPNIFRLYGVDIDVPASVMPPPAAEQKPAENAPAEPTEG